MICRDAVNRGGRHGGGSGPPDAVAGVCEVACLLTSGRTGKQRNGSSASNISSQPQDGVTHLLLNLSSSVKPP